MQCRTKLLATLASIAVALAVGCQDSAIESSPDGATGSPDASSTDTGSRDLATSDSGGCPDGSAQLPPAMPGKLVATEARPDELAMDGALDEWAEPTLEYRDDTGAIDAEVTLFARWTSGALYVGAEVADDSVEASASVGPWKNDSLEIAFDPDASGGDALQGDERKWVVDVDENVQSGRAENDNWVETSEQRADAAARETGEGYAIEIRIPWDQIGGSVAPGSGNAPNLVVATNDRDAGEVDRLGWTSSIDGLRTPSEWGTLELVADPCGPNDAGVTDTSGDAGMEDDGDAGGDSEPRLGPPHHLSESDFNFETTLNAVDDLGMDPTGQDPIDQKLDDARDSNTLIVFPPGKYKIEAGPDRNATHNWGPDAEHFGIKGLGDEPKDVQFVVEQQPANYGGRWIQDHGGVGLMLKNFAIQMSRDRYTSADIWIQKDDLALMEKVEWAGMVPSDDHGNAQLLAFEITDQSGVGEINRLYIREGSWMQEYPDGMGGLRVSLAHVGTLYLTDMWIENMNSSAFRFTKVPGRVGVEGGFFKNNSNTNLRGGAGDHPDGPSYMRGATVVLDTENTNDYLPDSEKPRPTNAVTIDTSGQGYSGLIVEDIDIYFLNPPPRSEVIRRPSYGEHGAFTVRDVRIRNESDGFTTLIQPVSMPSDETGRFENIQVTGSGSGELRADPATTAEIVDSCVESNFSIENFDVEQNVDRSGCESPKRPMTEPHDH